MTVIYVIDLDQVSQLALSLLCLYGEGEVVKLVTRFLILLYITVDGGQEELVLEAIKVLLVNYYMRRLCL